MSSYLPSSEYVNNNPKEISTHSKPAIVPTLVIGLGGTGIGALRHLKRRLIWLWHYEQIQERFRKAAEDTATNLLEVKKDIWQEFEMAGGIPNIQMLGVDTWPWNNPPDEAYLNESEYAYIGGYNASNVLGAIRKDPESHPEIAEWWTWPESTSRAGQIHSGARQIRAIGRLSFYRKFRTIWSKLQPKIAEITSIDSKQKTENQGYDVMSAGLTKRIYIIGSLCGGTGAGTFLDTAACLRAVANLSDSAIFTGIFVLPSVFLPTLKSDLQKDRVRANAYASLKELTYFMSNSFHVHLPGEKPKDIPLLYNRLYLVELANEAGESLNSIDDVYRLIANQIFLEGLNDVGAKVWEYDANIANERQYRNGQIRSYIFSSFANSSLEVPHEEIAEYARLSYAVDIIENGMIPPEDSLDPDQRNRLNAEAAQMFSRLESKHHEFIFGQEGLQQDASAVQAEPLKDTAVLEQFVQEMNENACRRSLTATKYVLNSIKESINTEVERSQRQNADADKTLAAASVQRNSLENSRPRLAVLGNIWPFSYFFRSLSADYQRRLRNTRRDETNARAAKEIAEKAHLTWLVLQENIAPLAEQLDARGLTLKNLCAQWRQDMKQLFAADRPVEQNPYEMHTQILGEEFIKTELYPQLRKEGLTAKCRLDALELLSSPEFRLIKMVTAQSGVAGAQKERFLNKLQICEIDPQKISNGVMNMAGRTITNKMNENRFFMRNILAPKNPRVQKRLRNLFDRCQPFWSYDLDRGGINEMELEKVVFTGVDNKDEFWRRNLRDCGEFAESQVSTGDPYRVEACVVKHGLPIEYLTSLPDMKDKYDQFLDTEKMMSGPMQLAGDWERGQENALPEITLENQPDKKTRDGAPNPPIAAAPEPKSEKPQPGPAPAKKPLD